MPVIGHPQFQPGVAGVVLRGRPHTGPVRTPVSADADQIQGLHVRAELRRRMMLEQHEGGPVSASQVSPDPPGRLADRGDAAGFSDHSQVTRRSSRSGPETQVPDPFPRQAPRRVLPERSSTSSPPCDGRSSAEAGVSPSIAESLPAVAPCRICSGHLIPLPGERARHNSSTGQRDNWSGDG